MTTLTIPLEQTATDYIAASARYSLNDIYPCIQGEGCQTGTAMVLVRLHGCGVGCPFCDTKETWHRNIDARVATIDLARASPPAWTEAYADEIAAYCRDMCPGPNWILLTGGEPAEQGLAPLVDAFHARGYKVALETSGTMTGHLGAALDWVCVSPKIGMPGGRAIVPEAVAVADEIKFVVGKAADLQKLEQLLAAVSLKPTVQICLQPMSLSQKATELCLETVMARGWRLSIQVHKLLGQR